MTAVDDVRYWRHPAVSGVDLIRAHYVNHGFGRHSHDTFAFGVATTGVEELWLDGEVHRVLPGGLVMINPGVVHTGRPAVEAGWAYRAFYPDVEVVAEVAGTASPWFTEQVVYDADAAAVVVAAHRAAESADRLAASSLLGQALSRLLRTYGGTRVPPPSVGGRDVEAAREILHERLAEPPSLAELAAEVGTGQFALLRAFRARHGLPPHPTSTSCASAGRARCSTWARPSRGRPWRSGSPTSLTWHGTSAGSSGSRRGTTGAKTYKIGPDAPT